VNCKVRLYRKTKLASNEVLAFVLLPPFQGEGWGGDGFVGYSEPNPILSFHPQGVRRWVPVATQRPFRSP